MRKEESSQFNNLNFHIKKLREKEQTKPQASRRKDIMITIEMNEIQNIKSRKKNPKVVYLKRSRGWQTFRQIDLGK